MVAVSHSRRMVIGAGAVAGAAVLAPLILRRQHALAGSDADGITVIPGQLVAFRNDPAELRHWSTMVGRPVRLVGSDGAATGVVAAVEPRMPTPRCPAGVRQQPFTVRFAVDRIGAPAGDAIYDIGTTIDGLSRLFLQRGLDQGNKAILTALFN